MPNAASPPSSQLELPTPPLAASTFFISQINSVLEQQNRCTLEVYDAKGEHKPSTSGVLGV